MPTRVTDPDILTQLNAPDRHEVASSPRVWGDDEAEQAGLYEPRNQPAMQRVTNPALLSQLNGVPAVSFSERFAEHSTPENSDALRSGLIERGAELTRGPRASPMQSATIDLTNQVSAASQGATPNIGAHQSNLISTDTYENDAGDVLYRDPATGQVIPTDKSKHVVLRDPSDNRVKVFARTPETEESAIVGASRVLAPGLAAGAPTARAAIGGAKAIQPAASDIFATAKPYYRAFDKEAELISVPASSTVERLRNAVERGRQPEHLAPEVYKTIDNLKGGGGHGHSGPSRLDRLESEMNRQPPAPPVEKMVTLAELRDLKELIGQSFKSSDSRVRAAASFASKEINKIISEASKEAGTNLKTADAIHSTARSVQELQRKGDIAGLRTGRAGYGGNAVNSMRQVLSPIVQKSIEGKLTGFQPGEIAAMREIVEGTPVTNAARLVGQMSPTKGVIQGGGSVAAVVAAGPVGLAIPALGVASNKLATVLTGKQIDRLKELVAKRSPAYSAAVSKATERYTSAQAEFASRPSPNNFAAYLSASRLLAKGLSHDGVQISSGDLLRAIQGPMRSASDDE